MEYVLETSNLCKRYRGFTALSSLSMHVPKGAIYGFVGRNGAGKTTLIRLICGLQQPTEGGYSLYGVRHTLPAIARSRRRMGAVVETPSIYMDMTARENLMQQYLVLGLPSFDGIDELLRLVGLGDAGRKKARNFSLGMRQRLGIAIALAGRPDFLVLDEPVNGLIDGGRMVREMSAQELENASRKCMRLTVSDVKALALALDELGAEYRILSPTEAQLFTPLSVTRLTRALSARQCELLHVHEQNESLESFYMNLVGGERHA